MTVPQWHITQPPGIGRRRKRSRAMTLREGLASFKPAEPSESQIQRALIGHLERRAWPGVAWFHVPNGGSRTAAEAARFRAEGVVAGVPDLVIVHEGRALFLELKARKGRVSTRQAEMHARLAEAGAAVAVCHGLDQALAQLERWGVLR